MQKISQFFFLKKKHSFHTTKEVIWNENLASINEKRFCSLPALVKAANNVKIGITEADLYDYPCSFLKGTGKNALQSKFPQAVLEAQPKDKGSDRNEKIVREAEYIAQTEGTRMFPWRVFMLSENDAKLIENQMVWSPRDTDNADFNPWVKPGQVAQTGGTITTFTELTLNRESIPIPINIVDFAVIDFGLEYIILITKAGRLRLQTCLNPTTSLT